MRILWTALLFGFLLACGNKQEETVDQNPISHADSTASLEDGIYAHFTTNRGNFVVELFYEEAPLTASNFIALAEGDMPNTAKEKGVPYFDGLIFHRVISVVNGDGNDFMIQGGDPLGTGSGGPGYSFKDEFSPKLSNVKGTISMANSGINTNGSQFFINLVDNVRLDYNKDPITSKHAVFGKVVQGFPVVYNTVQGDQMKEVRIERVGEAAQKFDALQTFNDLK